MSEIEVGTRLRVLKPVPHGSWFSLGAIVRVTELWAPPGHSSHTAVGVTHDSNSSEQVYFFTLEEISGDDFEVLESKTSQNIALQLRKLEYLLLSDHYECDEWSDQMNSRFYELQEEFAVGDFEEIDQLKDDLLQLLTPSNPKT